MATVGIWKVCSSLSQVIKYTTNNEKIDTSNYKDLDQSLKYVKNDFKTEKQLLVGGINCNPNNALKEMVDVKERFMKTDGILAWHGYHSYKEGEITPELAQEVGMKVAEEMWGDEFQVVVTTHINGNCIHNHFVVNSVSFVDGKKYYGNRTTYAELRRISNVVCSEYSLSTLEEKITKSGINYLHYQNKSLEYTNYYKTAKKDLDSAISSARNYQEFITLLKKMNYEVTLRSGKLCIKKDGYKRNIRIERYFGSDYSIENINKQIQGLYIPIRKTRNQNNIKLNNHFLEWLKPKYKYNSFYGMYIRYCKLLRKYSQNPKIKVLPSMKKDIEKLDLLSSHAIFLANNNIESEEQFFSVIHDKEKKLDELKSKREKFYQSFKETNEEDNIDLVLKEIKELKKDLKLCEDIRIRKEQVKDNLKIIEEKEMVNDEFFK